MQLYYVPYGKEEEHADNLRAGLIFLGHSVNAYICAVCQGKGQYEQQYTAGCGGGCYRSQGPCNWCRGIGLMQADKGAPGDLVLQVVEAGKTYLGR